MWYDIFQLRKLLQKDILRLQGKAEPWGVEEEGPSDAVFSPAQKQLEMAMQVSEKKSDCLLHRLLN